MVGVYGEYDFLLVFFCNSSCTDLHRNFLTALPFSTRD